MAKNWAMFKARKSLGLTQKEVAKGIGSSLSAYSSFENMQRYPTEDMQETICSFYNSLLRKRGEYISPETVFSEEVRTATKYMPKGDLKRPEMVSLSAVNPRDLPSYNPEGAIIGALDAPRIQEETEEVLYTLSPREENVLRLRFGIGDDCNHTLEDVGRRFDVTRETIRRIEAKAMRKLGHPTRRKRLKEFY